MSTGDPKHICCVGLQASTTSRQDPVVSEPDTPTPGLNNRPAVGHMPSTHPSNRTSRTEPAKGMADGNPQIFALRGGEPLPDGYIFAVRDPSRENPVDSTPTKSARATNFGSPPGRHVGQAVNDHADKQKSVAAARRNLTRNANKKAHASYVKEVKESLATGRPVTINVAEGQHDLKSRWHAAAKEAAYKLLDLRKEGWKDYTLFEKSKVRDEINDKYHFDPPIDPRKVDKYLAGHLRTSRGVWKAHWQKHGDDNRHPNCPVEAWGVLIKRWPTGACMEEAVEMAGRRSLVQNASKTGRNSLLDRMDEEVGHTSCHNVDDALHCKYICCGNVYLKLLLPIYARTYCVFPPMNGVGGRPHSRHPHNHLINVIVGAL